MAKQPDVPRSAESQQGELHELAKQLFAIQWTNLRGQKSDEHFAAVAYAAAAKFMRISSRVREGQDPESLVSEA